MGELQLQPQQIAIKGSLNKNGFYLWGLVDGMAEVNNYTHPQDNLTHAIFQNRSGQQAGKHHTKQAQHVSHAADDDVYRKF